MSDFGEEKRPAPDASREELLALADEFSRLAKAADGCLVKHVEAYKTFVWVKRNKIAAALRKAAPVALKEATAAQHFDLPKGTPAKFVRNGVLETCQCLDCRALIGETK
jgi:hypothetical protein